MSRSITRLDWSASITAEPREPHSRADLHRGPMSMVSLNQVRTVRSREIESPFPGSRRSDGTERHGSDVRLIDVQQT